MALRCVYTDLDGTLLGKGSSLFRDAEGAFSLAQSRGLEACHRAGVEVVIMSGRREPQVHECARLMGQTSYIYEAGCAFAIDGETTLMTGEMVPDEDGTVYEKIEQRGIPKLLFEHFEGRLEYHAPWHTGRILSHLFRGKVDVEEANRLLEAEGHDDLRLLDNGAIGREMPADRRPHPRLPPGSQAGQQGGRGRRPRPRPRLRPGRLHRRRRLGRGPRGRRRGRPLLRRRQRARARPRPARRRSAAWDNATVTEGAMGDGFYEAVVSTLVERR